MTHRASPATGGNRRVTFHRVEHGTGLPVLVLHGGGVDHREAEACFEPGLGALPGLRRVYPDLPGSGRTPAPAWLAGSDDVLDALLDLADEVADAGPLLVVGHSAGAYLARGLAARRPAQVAGLALVCPLTGRERDVPAHRVVAGPGDLGDDEFRGYFVVQTPAMLDRYEGCVAPGAALQDHAAEARIGARWRLTADEAPYPGPTLVVAGRLDSTVGHAGAADVAAEHPHASLAVLDGTGHALPHERPAALAALLAEWWERVEAA